MNDKIVIPIIFSWSAAFSSSCATILEYKTLFILSWLQCYTQYHLSALHKHPQEHHVLNDGVVVDCGICEKQFNTKNSRSAHQYQSHTLEERQVFKEVQAKIKEESLNNVQEEEFVSDEIFESDNDIDSAVTLD